jgi:uncharacterized membrane protein
MTAGLTMFRLRIFWDSLRGTYWFVPMVMTIAAAVLAYILFQVDAGILNSLLQNKWYILNLDEAAARTLLTTIAISSLGVIGVVFSVTLVPLSIAASQFGPILLRAFLRDIITQLVLGTFCATISYCIFLLLFFRTSGPNPEVPQISITVSLLLLIISLSTLVYFFHHVAVSLQATTVVAVIYKEVKRIIETEYPKKSSLTDCPNSNNHSQRQVVLHDGLSISATGTGYIQAINYSDLVRIAEKNNLILYLKKIPGEFVSSGNPLLIAWSPEHINFDSIGRKLNRVYFLGSSRTLIQDIRFGISLLVVVASRALSPAVNDPVTPIMCLDRIEAALSKYVERGVQSPNYYDKNHNLRVITDPINFRQLIHFSFDLIRQYGRGTAEILLRVLRVIETIANQTSIAGEREVLLKYAQLIESDSRIGLPSEYDRNRVHEEYERTIETIRRHQV